MNYTKWLHQRETFKWLAYLMIFIYGLENQTTKYFLLYYFKDRFHIQTAQAVIYYSVTEALYSVAQIIGGAVIGRYTDRTRNLRRVVVGVMLLSFGGNFLYVLHGHLWLVILGRFLMGFTESLQTAVIGEVRRSYQNEQEKLKTVISWYEVFNQLGMNIGAGLPILFTGFRIRIGYLKLDKYNMVNLVIAVFSFVLAVVSYYKVTNLSKNLAIIDSKNQKIHSDSSGQKTTAEKLDQSLNIKEISSAHQNKHCQRKSPTNTKHLNNETKAAPGRPDPSSTSLMKYSDLLQFDIITLCLAYGMVRYSVGTFISNMTIIAPSEYHWSLSTLLIVVMTSNWFTLAATLLLVKHGFFIDNKRNFYLYVTSLAASSAMMTSFMLTNIGVLDILPKQILLFAILNITKNFIYFQGQLTNTFLILQTVNPQDSSFITGVRGAVGTTFKGFGYTLASFSSHYPQYHSPVVAMFTLIFAVLILWRRNLHLQRSF
ncbi:uncharacterized protein [Clytia hemisphaerica]|uniref:Major facilitator superfamily (MFS) profile domain-containing protein n=1 Tax=Clytia hemisphaerica TaxID=252671 RepID=A0A7M5UXN1_9CNID